MTILEIKKLIEEDLAVEGVNTLEIAVNDYNNVGKTIGSVEIRICNLDRFDDNIASFVKSRLNVFTEETGIKIKKKAIILN